jgi:hypothetical protein
MPGHLVSNARWLGIGSRSRSRAPPPAPTWRPRVPCLMIEGGVHRSRQSCRQCVSYPQRRGRPERGREHGAAEVDLNDTRVVVTSDHSHVLTIAGYDRRGDLKAVHPAGAKRNRVWVWIAPWLPRAAVAGRSRIGATLQRFRRSSGSATQHPDRRRIPGSAERHLDLRSRDPRCARSTPGSGEQHHGR